MNEITKIVRVEDMPSDDMRLVAESCGLDVALRLMQGVGGMSIYVPKNPFVILLERIIRQNEEINYKELAMATGMTERYVRNLARRVRNADKQRDIFEYAEDKQDDA